MRGQSARVNPFRGPVRRGRHHADLFHSHESASHGQSIILLIIWHSAVVRGAVAWSFGLLEAVSLGPLSSTGKERQTGDDLRRGGTPLIPPGGKVRARVRNSADHKFISCAALAARRRMIETSRI